MKKAPEQPENTKYKRTSAVSVPSSLSCIKGSLGTGKFATLGNYLGHFHAVLADNNEGVMRTNYLVTDCDFKNLSPLQY